MRGALLWIAVFAAYVAVALLLSPGDAPPQVPLLLQRLRGETGADVTAIVLCVPAALSFAFGAALARRWVPDPWATRGVLLAAVSAPALELSAHTRPDAPAAALLTGGLVLALRTREDPTRRRVLGSAACFALAPWFALPYALAAAPALVALIVWTYRRRRPLLGLLAIEIGGASIVALAEIEQPVNHGRGDLGTLLPAPVLLLALVGVALLVRSRREHLARAIPARRDAEAGAALTALMVVGLLLGAAFGPVDPGAAVPLAAALGAWGLQREPRIGYALGVATVVLAALTVR